MRLIDADDFIARLDHVPMVQDAIKKAMDHMPTIEPECKTGKWIEIYDADEYGEPYPSGVTCSECGFCSNVEDNYCPNCGADMR